MKLREDQEEQHGHHLVGLMVGMLAGLIVGVLYAPGEGEKTRKTLKEKHKQVSKKVNRLVEEIQDSPITKTVKEVAKDVRSNPVTKKVEEVVEDFADLDMPDNIMDDDEDDDEEFEVSEGKATLDENDEGDDDFLKAEPAPKPTKRKPLKRTFRGV